VLLRLAEAPGDTMRMKDLADCLLLSRMIGTDHEDSRPGRRHHTLTTVLSKL
jgi:hypothetical protein